MSFGELILYNRSRFPRSTFAFQLFATLCSLKEYNYTLIFQHKYHIFTKSFNTFMAVFLSVMIASVMFYFGSRSNIAYAFFGVGFLLMGISILLGFAKMISDK